MPPGPTPTVDEARQKLGGRASTSAIAGEIVGVPTSAGGVQAGVVVFASGDDRDVWVGEGKIRRVVAGQLVPAPVPADALLAPVAADARLYASMHEGQAVRFLAHDGAMRAGQLVEKCRFGALVLAGDDKIVAVSFRRLWPASDHEIH